MFSLTISFGNPVTMWTLMWRTKEPAEAIWNQFKIADNGRQIIIEDDFGQRSCFTVESVHGVMFEDMELSKLAHVERALHQARMQAKGQEMAQNDPVLKAARFQQGPAVLMPGMNGGGFPQR